MNLRQLHYTFAPSGSQSGPDRSALRPVAVSPGVCPAVEEEAGRLLAYEPPPNAPGWSSPEEVARFPVAFSHHRLSDGSRLLCRTVCTAGGGGHAPRQVYAHALHLPQDGPLPGGLLPIEAWESPSWAERLPNGQAPAPLAELVPARCIDKAGLVDFVGKRAERLEGFLADVRTLFRSPDAPQLLVIEEDSGQVAHWIAVASAVLPRELAHRLTFTTYTGRPMLARQQIVGTVPTADFTYARVAAERRYRVHDCTGGPCSPARGDGDPWAAVAARVLLAGRPALFTEAARLRAADDREARHDAGRLAALALRDGVALDANGRTAAARWLAEHPGDGSLLRRVVTALAAADTARTAQEWAALGRLSGHFARLRARPAGIRLARDLREELSRTEAGTPVNRLAGLLRLAGALGMDERFAPPALCARLTAAALGEPAADRAAVWTMTEAHPGLRAALLTALEHRAAKGEVAAVAAAVPESVPMAGGSGHPHLRLAVALAAARRERGPADRAVLFNTLMVKADSAHQHDPDVLRAAFHLVWGDAPITAGEAGRLLDRWSDEGRLTALRAAGLDETFLRAALDSAPDDRDAPRLAGALLRHGMARTSTRQGAALRLLEEAGRLETDLAAPGFTGRMTVLTARARPLEPGIARRSATALADRLLLGADGLDELPALVRSGDPGLLAGYARRARSQTVAHRLRREPALAARCFIAWQSLPGAGPLWDDTREQLLATVLRPAVRRMRRESLAELERCLGLRGGSWPVRYRDWNRLGVVDRWRGWWGAVGVLARRRC
ncbi:GTPase-associated protein 1-related protein [Streptomyces orinoci]|uniref:GTPase-associated protein 1-related protein n=1 Tax=Streptomyces orinoci TaxID=67339 RepID=UPI001F4EB399|nr:GTPase-associated protein 1-related protein [Streptomyces orinoci]